MPVSRHQFEPGSVAAGLAFAAPGVPDKQKIKELVASFLASIQRV